MNGIFHCYSCGKELEVTQLRYLPGQQIYDPISKITYNNGTNYCDQCYQALTTSNKEKDSLTKKMNLIKDLEPNLRNVNLLVTVVVKESEKEIKKYGKKLRLGVFLVKDETGEIRLTLWNEIIDQIKEKDALYLENAFIRKWENENQLTLGEKGKIENRGNVGK